MAIQTITSTPGNSVSLKEALKKWKPSLKVETSDNGDSVIATAKSLDVTSAELKELADITGDDWTISFGRSGANFRMIIW